MLWSYPEESGREKEREWNASIYILKDSFHSRPKKTPTRPAEDHPARWRFVTA